VYRNVLPYVACTRQTPSAEATAQAQCASPTDLKVDRTSLKLWQTSGGEANEWNSCRSSQSDIQGKDKITRGHSSVYSDAILEM